MSAWYAWHVLACPEVVLHRHTRCRDADQAYDLLAILFDFRHTGVLNDRWEYVLSLCAMADARSGRVGRRTQAGSPAA